MTQRTLWLQRRRHFVVALLLYISGLLGFGSLSDGAGPSFVFTSAAALTLVGLTITSIIILTAPFLRRISETLALSMLLTAILMHNDVIGTDSTRALLFVTFLLTLILYGALYGRWWNAVPFRFNWTTKRRFLAKCPPGAVWTRMVPDPANPGAHYSGVFLSQEPIGDDGKQVVQRTRAQDGEVMETTLTFEKVHSPNEISYDYESTHPGADYGRGHFRLTIAPTGKHSLVWFAETVESLVVPTAIDLWLDDFGGETRTAMQSALNDQAQPEASMQRRAQRHPVKAA